MIRTGTNAVLISLFWILSISSQAQNCTYKLFLYDSYGDGWQGGRLEVIINNTSTGIYSAINHGNTVDISVSQGDSLELIYTPGDYENENSYKLFDASWNLIHAAGPNPSTGAVFSTTGDCMAPVLPGGYPCTSIPIDTGQCIFANNTGVQSSGLNPGCAIYQGSDLWFSVVVPASGNLIFETDSGNINDTGLGIWSGNSCDSLAPLTCDDDLGAGYYSRVTLERMTPGQTLYIQVFGYSGAQGSFQLCVNEYIPVKLVSSELPIVTINTLGKQIVPETKVDCQMEIRYKGPGNLTFLSDIPDIYNGNAGIEIRGATSSGFPQKPFNIETRTATGQNNNVSILGMPEENDWVLISNYGDRSLLRNTLAARLFGEMGHYSTRFALCEVLIDSSYQGIYLWGEKIKRDKNRVNIASLTAADTLGDDLTGGYILQQNLWDENNSFQSAYSPVNHPELDIYYLYEYPAPDVIHPLQKKYIASFIDSLETALYSVQFADPAIGYRKYLDTRSFIDYFLLGELSRSVDAFKKSIFYHKDKNSKGGKLKAGPAWDFDWAWKNIWGCSSFEALDGSGWAHEINDCGQQDVGSNGWYIRMLQDSTFRDELRCTYEGYRQTIFDTTHLFSYIDSMGLLVQNAQQRHYYKWPILGQVVVAPEVGAVATTYYGELDTLKGWITRRLHWLDDNIPGLCKTSGTATPAISGNLRCYPNPAGDYFITDYYLPETTTVSIRLYGPLGTEVFTAARELQDAGQHSLRISTGGLPPGVYLLRFESGSGVAFRKVVVER